MRFQKKVILPILAVSVVVLSGLLYYRFVYKVQFGLLGVQTLPEGAAVYVDGDLKGETPVEFELKEGEYDLLLKRDGYDDIEDRVVVTREISDIRGYAMEQAE